jgi:tetratricopeptide (TPR) repeat protein
MSEALLRGRLLLSQGRYEMAEEELRRALGDNPTDASVHSLLAICLTELKKFGPAVESARNAVGQAPDDAYCHYALAYSLFHAEADNYRNAIFPNKSKFKEAETPLLEAIRLNPEDADFFATLASIRLARDEWDSALEAAGQGLSIDAENIGCANARATALVKLGRNREAADMFEAALSKDPENTHTHANKGWALLHAGEPSSALDHFKEALRLDPQNAHARSGIVEALKARNFVYRWMLAYFLWMSRLPSAVQWGVILGGYLGMKLLGKLERDNPAIAPYILPVMILYALFVVMTWTAPHLFNLLLRLDKYGKHALSNSQIWGANCVGLCLAAALVFGGLAFWLGSGIYFIGALGSLGLMIPVGGTFNRSGKARMVLGIYTAVLAVIGIASILLLAMGSAAGLGIGQIFVLGLILFSWGSNILVSRM